MFWQTASIGFARFDSAEEFFVDTNTLLIILILLVVFGGGGFYGRGRWW
jgi:hypothetical protein